MHSQQSTFAVIVSASTFELLDAAGNPVMELASSSRTVRTPAGTDVYNMNGLVFEAQGNELAPALAALLHGPHPTLPTTRGAATVLAAGAPNGDPVDAPQLIMVADGAGSDNGYVKLQNADAVSATTANSGAHLALTGSSTFRQAQLAAPGRSTVPIEHAVVTLNGSSSSGGDSSAVVESGAGYLALGPNEVDLLAFGSNPMVIDSDSGSITGSIGGDRRLTLDSSQAIMRVGASGGFVQAAPNHVGVGPTSSGRLFLNARTAYLPTSIQQYDMPASISPGYAAFIMNGIAWDGVDGDVVEITATLRILYSGGGAAFIAHPQIFGPGGNTILPERLVATQWPVFHDAPISGTWRYTLALGTGAYAATIIGGQTGGTYTVVAPDTWMGLTNYGIR